MVGRSVTRFAGFAVGRADLMILISAFFIMDDYTKPGVESSIVANSIHFFKFFFKIAKHFFDRSPASTIHLLALAAHAALGPGRKLVDVLDVCQPVLPGHRAHQVMPVALDRFHAQ